jgi:hypothetical protein
MMLADGSGAYHGWDPLFLLSLVIFLLGAANAMGVVSLVLSFTRFRHSRVALLCAVVVIGLGAFFLYDLIVFYTESEARRRSHPHPTFLWLPLPLGLIGLARWYQRKKI